MNRIVERTTPGWRAGLGAVLLAGMLSRAGAAPDLPAERVDSWQGFARHQFTVAGKAAWVVVPAHPAPGAPWTWVTEFPDAFTPRTGVPVLLRDHGIHHAHIRDFNGLGCEQQLKVMDAFHAWMIQHGFSARPVMIGLSRGGFMAYRWAARNPGKVAGIYGDAPVCDLKSWPGGFGRGKGSRSDWELARKLYGWASDDEGRAFRGNALDDEPLAALAGHGVPLLHVVGTDDVVVPVDENTAILERKYRKLGGAITVIPHPAGHHPHGLDDPAPIVEFILRALRAAEK